MVLLGFALASDLPEALLEDDFSDLEIEKTALEEELEKARAALEEAEAGSTRAVALDALLADVAEAQDPRLTPDDRAAALSRVTERAQAIEEEALAVQVLLGATTDRDPIVQTAGVTNLERLAAVDALRWTAMDRRAEAVTGLHAIDALERLASPQAGDALVAIAEDDDVSRALRSHATEALTRTYPERLDTLAETANSTRGGITGAAIGNTMLGGTVLSSVGVWGGSDAGVAIGVVGGGAIGSGTAIVYGLNNPVSTADGTRYASSVGWGLTNGILLGEAINSYRGYHNYEDTAALTRMLGVSVGAGQAWYAYQNDLTDTHDVWESNTAGWLGAGTALGLAVMATDELDLGDKAILLSTAAGSGVGLATQALVRHSWDPNRQHAAFAAVIGTNGVWTTRFLPVALTNTNKDDELLEDGRGLFAFHASTALGLAAAHKLQPTGAQNRLMAGGNILGNSLGAGVPLLADQDRQTTTAVMLSMGLAGAAVGYDLADRTEWTSGDRAMLGVGMPILTLHSLGYGGVLSAKRRDFDHVQMAGMMLTGAGLGGVGLTALSQRVDPTPGEMLVLGSGAVWGAWFGSLTPVAVGLDGDPVDLLLVTLLCSDAGLVGAGALTYGLGVQPRSTLVPQLGALSGATVGSLGVALVSGDGQAVAGGALVGSVLGFAGGSVLQMSVLEGRQSRWMAPKPTAPRLAGWGFTAAPWATESGDPGVYAQLTWTEQ